MKSLFWKKFPHTFRGSILYTNYSVTIVHSSNKISKNWYLKTLVLVIEGLKKPNTFWPVIVRVEAETDQDI